MLALLLLACLGTVSAFESRIVGGHGTNIHHYPYIISLGDIFGGSHICGGTIIDDNWVLTAAHCVTNSASRYRVTTNDGYRDDPSRTTYTVNQKISHPSYGQGAGAYPNDIALLYISSTITDHVHKAATVAEPGDNFVNHNCHIAGWGLTTGGGSLANQLQETNGKILSDSECSGTWGSNYNGNAHICIDNLNSGACNGDSGGPMECSHKLAGVTSWGASGCPTNYPSVYARVSSYYDWITTYVNLSA